MLEALALHLNDFVVTGAIIEWIRFLHEIVHDIRWIQYRHPSCVMP